MNSSTLITIMAIGSGSVSRQYRIWEHKQSLSNAGMLTAFKYLNVQIFDPLHTCQLFLLNPFSMGTRWTLYKVYGGFRISYGTG